MIWYAWSGIPPDAILVMYGSVPCNKIVSGSTSNVQIYIYQSSDIFFVAMFESPGTYYGRNKGLYGKKQRNVDLIPFDSMSLAVQNVQLATLKKHLSNLFNLKVRFEDADTDPWK